MMSENNLHSRNASVLPHAQDNRDQRSRLLQRQLEHHETIAMQQKLPRSTPPAKQTLMESIQDLINLDTLHFLEAVFTVNDTDVASAKHLELPLVNFISLHPSSKLLPFAHSKLDDSTYRFSLHFLQGKDILDSDTTEDEIKWISNLKTFFDAQFGHELDSKSIDKCTQASRSLFLVAKTQNTNEDGVIVSAINFASIDDIAIFVNWVATKNGTIDHVQFGEKFYFESRESQWKHHHMATFLLHITQLCLRIKINHSHPTMQHVSIVLQSRVEGTGADNFYSTIGFEDVAVIDMESELFQYLPTMAATIIAQADSPDNMTSFIFDHSLTLMMNKSGNVQEGLQVPPVEHQYPYLCVTEKLQKNHPKYADFLSTL